jgi:hypothetical protein
MDNKIMFLLIVILIFWVLLSSTGKKFITGIKAIVLG